MYLTFQKSSDKDKPNSYLDSWFSQYECANLMKLKANLQENLFGFQWDEWF